MAFTCKPCHKLPMSSWCATMFEIGRADSYGPCENCRVPSACMDCSCATKREDMPDPMEAFISTGSEACMNDCCESCPGKTEDDELCGHICHLHADAANQEHERTFSATGRLNDVNNPNLQNIPVRAENWQRCGVCGKTGSHEHPRGAARAAAKSFSTVYAEADTESTSRLATTLGLTDEQARTLVQRILDRFPGLRRFVSILQVHDQTQFEISADPDPEHESGNPNCLCFQPECMTRARVRLPRSRDG